MVDIVDFVVDIVGLELEGYESTSETIELKSFLDELLLNSELKGIEVCTFVETEFPKFVEVDRSSLRKVLKALLGALRDRGYQGQLPIHVNRVDGGSSDNCCQIEIGFELPGWSEDSVRSLYAELSSSSRVSEVSLSQICLEMMVASRLLAFMGGRIEFLEVFKSIRLFIPSASSEISGRIEKDASVKCEESWALPDVEWRIALDECALSEKRDWTGFSQRLDLTELEGFSGQLCSIGEQRKNSELVSYARSFGNRIGSMDLDWVKGQLDLIGSSAFGTN